MPCPAASLPHPSSALVEKVGDLVVISREWYRKLSEIADRVPVNGTVTFAAATMAAVTFDTPPPAVSSGAGETLGGNNIGSTSYSLKCRPTQRMF